MNFFKKETQLKHTINYMKPNVEYILKENLLQFLNKYHYEHWVIVCIGTDRSTGDSLGPLVGTKLKLFDSNNFFVLGNLDEPVHAINLDETIKFIKENYSSSGIIAIDASLGQISSVGNIQVVDGPLKPGAGVNKELAEIGDFHITGIVNVGGFMEYFVLQNTRLSIVIKMAEIISKVILNTIHLNKVNKKENVVNE